MKLKLIYKYVFIALLVSIEAIAGVKTTEVSNLQKDRKIKLLQPGAQAPVSKLYDLNDCLHKIPVSGKWNFIAFWSLFCHSCISEMPNLQKILSRPEYKELEAFFISLDTKKMKLALINFAKKRKLSKTILLEEVRNNSFKTADKWGVVMTPGMFLVNPDGKVVFAHQGSANISSLLNFIFDALHNKQQSIVGGDTVKSSYER